MQAGGREVLVRVGASVHPRLEVLDRGGEPRALCTEPAPAIAAAETLRLGQFVPDAFRALTQGHGAMLPATR